MHTAALPTMATAIDSGMNAVEDFQAFHLANRGCESRLPSKHLHAEEVLANARDFLMKVPCLGVVDGFDALIAKMAIVLPPRLRRIQGGQVPRERAPGGGHGRP